MIQADVTAERMAETVTLHYWVLCISAQSGHSGRMKADARFSIRKQNADIAVDEVKSLCIGFSAAYLGISECCDMGSQSAASQ